MTSTPKNHDPSLPGGDERAGAVDLERFPAGCPEPEVLEDLAAGLVTGREKRKLQAHLRTCAPCASLASSLWGLTTVVRENHRHPWRAARRYLRGRMPEREAVGYLDHVNRCVRCRSAVHGGLLLMRFSELGRGTAAAAGAIARLPSTFTGVPVRNVFGAINRAWAVAGVFGVLFVCSVAVHFSDRWPDSPATPVVARTRKNTTPGEPSVLPPSVQQEVRLIYRSGLAQKEIESVIGDMEAAVLAEPGIGRTPSFHQRLAELYRRLAALESDPQASRRYEARSKEERDKALVLESTPSAKEEPR